MSWEVYSAKLHGVPRNRPWLWVVGLRADALRAGRPSPRLSPIPAECRLTLADILGLPRASDDPDRLLIGQVAGANVRAAAEKAKAQGMQGYWMVTRPLGSAWASSVAPRDVMPCLLHANKEGCWIGLRGRHASLAELARAQGLAASHAYWPARTVGYAL